MARVFITGSSDGLGLMAAQLLVEEGHSVVQAWLAVSDDPAATVSGEYFYHMKKRSPHPATRNVSIQDRLLDFCSRATGVELTS